MNVKTHGIILGTKNFPGCVAFHRDVVGLPQWFEKPGLVCFRFGDGYLMVETEEPAAGFTAFSGGNPTMLRFNVDDVVAEAETLRAKGIAVEIKTFAWGVVGTFHDPDGNPCELKDAGDPFFK